MTEQRWGEEWLPGMRVKVFNRYEKPGQIRHGTIVKRSWGRDRGKPIYWFTIKLDGVDEQQVFDPGWLQQPDE